MLEAWESGRLTTTARIIAEFIDPIFWRINIVFVEDMVNEKFYKPSRSELTKILMSKVNKSKFARKKQNE